MPVVNLRYQSRIVSAQSASGFSGNHQQNVCLWFHSFSPEAFGLWVLSLPVSVCVCLSVCVSTFACPSDSSAHVPARIT